MSQWVEDGHRVTIVWDGDELLVDHVACPFEGGGSGSLCRRQRDYCVVSRYLGVYGPELNTGGKVKVDGPVEVAWAAQLGQSDLDDEFAGIWVIPVNDISYMDHRDQVPELEE